jgi:hypothetical protein
MMKRTRGGPIRLWIKPGTKAKFIFLDSQPWCIYEHNPYIDGSWRNQTTCPGSDSPEGCPLCDIGDEPEYVGFLSIGNFAPWTDNNGKEHTFTKQLFAMKQKVWKIMAAAAEKRGDLTGWVVEAYRTAKEEPSTGLAYDFEEKIPQSEWKARFGSRIITYGDQTIDSYLKPIDYDSILAPKATSELRRLANRLKYKGGDTDDGATAKAGDAAKTGDDDIPF